MIMVDRSYAAFIFSHGRANRVATYDALIKGGYTGKIYVVIDDEDDDADEYFDRFGVDQIMVFSKDDPLARYDFGMVNPPRGAIGYAKTWLDHTVAGLGLTHYIMCDDDIQSFAFKFFINGHSREMRAHCLDAIFEAMFGFLDTSGAIAVCPSQGGDYIGGAQRNDTGGKSVGAVKRRCVNVFFCRVGKPIQWAGIFNEDISAYTLMGQRGELFFTINHLMMHQLPTMVMSGGMTDSYQRYGLYVKVFFVVMHCPSCVKVSAIQGTSSSLSTGRVRFHHRVAWKNCVPMILSERYRKRRGEC